VTKRAGKGGSVTPNGILSSSLLGVLLLVLLVAWLIRRSFAANAEIARLQQVESGLAVAQTKLARIPELQTELTDCQKNYEHARTACSAAETNLAKTETDLESANFGFGLSVVLPRSLGERRLCREAPLQPRSRDAAAAFGKNRPGRAIAAMIAVR
jgi:hypothetical protein